MRGSAFRLALLTTAAMSLPSGAAAQTAQSPASNQSETRAPAQGEVTPAQTPQSALADDTSPAADAEAGVEDVVVTGIRASIAEALNTKRNAAVVLDSISAQDIGKLPDQNVSETLSRIPGVQISRREGEGAKINVRGIDLNRTLLNGHNFVGASNNGEPNFQDFPSEILGSVDIIKSPSAELAEGWLGAIINLKTRRPLDLGKTLIAGRAQGVYADKAEEFGGKVSGAFGTTLIDDKLGVLVSGTYNRFRGRTDLFSNRGYSQLTGVPLSGPGASAPRVFRPNRFEATVIEYDQKRYGVTGAIQWRPSDAFELMVDAFKQHSETDRTRFATQLVFPNTFTNTNVLADGTVDSATVNGVTVRPIIFDAPSETDAEALSFDAKFKQGGLTVKLAGSLSAGDNDGGNDQGLENFFGIAGNDFVPVVRQIAGNTASVTYSGLESRLSPDYALTTNYNFADLSQYEVFTIVDFNYRNRNRGKDANVDLIYEAGDGLIRALKAGARIERVTTRQSTDTRNYTAAQLAAGDPTPANSLRANETAGLVYSGTRGGLFSGQDGDFPRSVLGGSFDIDPFRSQFNAVIDQAATLAGQLNVQQTTKAGYGQVDFGGDVGGLEFAGNVGVRYIDTRRTSTGFDRAGAIVSPRSVRVGFEDWLPSFNFSLLPAERVTVRAAAAKVLARPPLSLTGVGINVIPTAGTGSAGNPLLRPFEADQYDVSAEWYFAPASLISVAGFYKNVSAFTTTITTIEDIPEIRAPGIDNTLYNISRPVNGTDGTIKGFEINYFHALTFLPEPFDGFGVNASFTRSTGRTPNRDALTGERLSLVNLSKTSYNLIGYYEKYGINARVAYNYRSGFLLTQQPASLGGSLFQRGRDQLDASVSYRLNSTFQVTLDALNLTRSVRSLYTGTRNRFTTATQDDRRFYFGVAATF